MTANRTSLAALAILASLCTLPDGVADTLQMVPHKDVRRESFGDVEITQVYDTLTPESWEISTKVTKRGKLILYLRNAQYQQFFSSPGHRVFVGLSNSGWPGSAILIFDDEGHIYASASHFRGFDYCKWTSTILKEWYDDKNPSIEFPRYEAPQRKFTVRGCRGNRIDIIALAAKNEFASDPELLLRLSALAHSSKRDPANENRTNGNNLNESKSQSSSN